MNIARLQEGMDLYYSMRLREAEDSFRGLMHRSARKRSRSLPHNNLVGGKPIVSRCRLLLHLAECRVLVALITEEPAVVKQANAMLDEAIDACESEQKIFAKLIKRSVKNSDSYRELEASRRDNVTCLAFGRLMKAALLLRSQSYLKGAWKIRNAWKDFEKLLIASEDEKGEDIMYDLTRSDLLFGAGVFHFFVSLIPPFLKKVVEIIGFTGDRSRGRGELEECCLAPGPRQSLARLVLLWILSVFYEDREAAEDLYMQSVIDVPRSSLFHYLGGYLARKRGDIELAINRFQRAEENWAELPDLQLACMYEIGWCHFATNDFEKASEYLGEFLDKFHYPSFRAFAGYQLGYAYHLTGRYSEAQAVMNKVPSWVRKNFSFDTYAARKALEYLESKQLSEFDIYMLKIRNMIEINWFDQASELVEELQETMNLSVLSPDERIQYDHIMAVLLRQNGKFEEAIEYCRNVLHLKDEVQREVYLIPTTLCELGEILTELNRDEEAHEALIDAKAFSDYDFDKVIQRRIGKNLDALDAKNRQ